MAPAKTPEPIIRRMSEVLMKMADDPEVKKAMVKAGANTVRTTPAQYREADPGRDRSVEAAAGGDHGRRSSSSGASAKRLDGRLHV